MKAKDLLGIVLVYVSLSLDTAAEERVIGGFQIVSGGGIVEEEFIFNSDLTPETLTQMFEKELMKGKYSASDGRVEATREDGKEKPISSCFDATTTPGTTDVTTTTNQNDVTSKPDREDVTSTPTANGITITRDTNDVTTTTDQDVVTTTEMERSTQTSVHSTSDVSRHVTSTTEAASTTPAATTSVPDVMVTTEPPISCIEDPHHSPSRRASSDECLKVYCSKHDICFYAINTSLKINYSEAEEWCKRINGSPAVIGTMQEYREIIDSIQSTMTLVRYKNFWLGVKLNSTCDWKRKCLSYPAGKTVYLKKYPSGNDANAGTLNCPESQNIYLRVHPKTGKPKPKQGGMFRSCPNRQMNAVLCEVPM